MYSKIVRQDSYESYDEFGTEYWIEGEDREGEPFDAVVLLGFYYSEEDDGYYLSCSVIWNGAMDYTGGGEVLIDHESMESGRFSPRVKREMEALLREILHDYPEFEDIEEFLEW
jgi:hypothetical protein